MNETPTRDPSKPDESPIEARLAAPPPTEHRETNAVGGGILRSKAAVVAILFLVTGCLGVPLLWANNRFRPAERWFWTVASTIYTAGLVWIVYLVLTWSYRQLVGG